MRGRVLTRDCSPRSWGERFEKRTREEVEFGLRAAIDAAGVFVIIGGTTGTAHYGIMAPLMVTTVVPITGAESQNPPWES